MTAITTKWPLKSLGDVAAKIPYAIVDGPFGSNMKTSDYVTSGVPVLQGKNITNDSFRWFDIRYLSNEKANELKRSSVRINDILLVKIGSIGYSAIIDSLEGHDFAIIPANLAKITPNQDLIDTRYLFRWLTSPDSKQYFQSNASKTAQPALSLGKIKALEVPLPPIPEQRRIAAILDQADALRTKRRETLAQLDSLTQSIFIEMFGDPSTNPRNWPMRQLSQLVAESDTINYGVVQPGDDVDDGVPLIRVGDLIDGRVRHDSLKKITPEIESAYKRSRLHGSEILVSCVGSVGVVVLADESVKGFNIARAVARIRLSSGMNRVFVAAHLQTESIQRYFTQELRTVSQPTLNIKQLSETKVMWPPVSLQQEFSDRINRLEKLKFSMRSASIELDALFASLQHSAFQGEL